MTVAKTTRKTKTTKANVTTVASPTPIFDQLVAETGDPIASWTPSVFRWPDDVVDLTAAERKAKAR